MDRPRVIKRADTVSGSMYCPDAASWATARLKFSISRWPVTAYKMEIPSRISPEPRQLKIRYRMAATTERPLSFATTATQAVMAAISIKT